MLERKQFEPAGLRFSRPAHRVLAIVLLFVLLSQPFAVFSADQPSVEPTLNFVGTGLQKSPYKNKDYELRGEYPDFPATFDVRYEFTPINQKGVGSCAAIAISKAAEALNYKKTGVDEQYAAGFLYGNRLYSDPNRSGISFREALISLYEYGVPELEDFPYMKEAPEIVDLVEQHKTALREKASDNRISGYCKLLTQEDIKYVLRKGGLIVASYYWDSKYYIADDHTLNFYGGTPYLHAVTLYGWNKNGFKFVNSAGDDWGYNGTAVMPYSVEFVEAWGIFM